MKSRFRIIMVTTLKKLSTGKMPNFVSDQIVTAFRKDELA